MKKLILIILLAFAASFGQINAQKPAIILSDQTGWHKIANKTVDFKRDRDEIPVLVADRFAAIKIMVKDAPIELNNLEVYYESGDMQVIEVRSPIKAGGETKVFDLKGSERDLKKIVIVYKTLSNQKDEKAEVEIWGFKSNPNKDVNSSGSPALVVSDKTGWHKIGERNVDFVRDRDEIMVIGADRFSAIKFKVTGAPIDLQDLEVYYESGDKQNIQVRSNILSGYESRVIDLNGGERNLKKIVFIYKTMPNIKDQKALVEIWGLKTNAK